MPLDKGLRCYLRIKINGVLGWLLGVGHRAPNSKTVDLGHPAPTSRVRDPEDNETNGSESFMIQSAVRRGLLSWLFRVEQFSWS